MYYARLTRLGGSGLPTLKDMQGDIWIAIQFFLQRSITNNASLYSKFEQSDQVHYFTILGKHLYYLQACGKQSEYISSVGAKSDQQVNICSFAVCCDQMWPSTQ